MEISPRIISKYLFISLLFLLPVQLGFHFWPGFSFLNGIRVDYLSPTVYLTDLLVASLVILNLDYYSKHKRVFVFLFIFGITNVLFSLYPAISFIRLIRIAELVCLSIFVYEQSFLDTKKMYKTLFYSAVIFSTIGILQFFLGKTLGGPLYFLGERSFNISTPGIALVSLFGRVYLRAYSTFSHPNSFAGYTSVVFILSLVKTKINKFSIFGYLLILFSIVASFSLSSFIGLFVFFFFALLDKERTTKLFEKYFLIFAAGISLFLPVFSAKYLLAIPYMPQTISQRLSLAYVSGIIISKHYLVGSGLNTFILSTKDFMAKTFNYWLFQPVHNIFLLIVSETGFLGLLLFLLTIYQSLKTQKKEISFAILFIITTGLFDHYWLTLQQNLLLFAVLVGLAFKAAAQQFYSDK